jgi:hypothetical protein
MRSGVAIGRNPLGCAMLLYGSCEESFSGSNIPVLAEQEIDREPLLIDRAIEVRPAASDLGVSLVNAPRGSQFKPFTVSRKVVDIGYKVGISSPCFSDVMPAKVNPSSASCSSAFLCFRTNSASLSCGYLRAPPHISQRQSTAEARLNVPRQVMHTCRGKHDHTERL